MTRDETVIRLVAKVRPLEQWRTARELRRRIRDRLERLDIDAHVPPTPPEEPPSDEDAAAPPPNPVEN
jgi:small conductance mechanosensitive channel